jgi:hypothetical protein
VLPRERGYTESTGQVRGGTDVYLAAAASSRWHLTVDGDTAARRKVFGWANAFAIDHDGAATLQYRTSPLRWMLLALQLWLWFWCLHLLRAARRGARA